ncbi:hypothetical protein F2P81_009420 [Scophthalmus maximus]|uniref:Uncharacterized protein n=1 Tax=Scophthalmus maximus TaxID=52904 RepID=A0A6A4SUN6_SCOMX|nr:hypothetical protein F2P81_009420 [Scophthalmus maximus]
MSRAPSKATSDLWNKTPPGKEFRNEPGPTHRELAAVSSRSVAANGLAVATPAAAASPPVSGVNDVIVIARQENNVRPNPVTCSSRSVRGESNVNSGLICGAAKRRQRDRLTGKRNFRDTFSKAWLRNKTTDECSQFRKRPPFI